MYIKLYPKKFFEAMCFKKTFTINEVVDMACIGCSQKYVKGGNISF